MSKGQGNSYQKNKSMCINKTRALHSEFFSKIRVEFRVGTSFSRVETSSEGSDITVPTRSYTNFREFSRIFAKIRVGHYWNISEIRKKSISETRENVNFGKKCLTQGLKQNTNQGIFLKSLPWTFFSMQV